MSRDIVLRTEAAQITKYRLPNSGSDLSKRDGFRLIFAVLNHKPDIYLVDVYPKRGPLAQVNVDGNDYKKCIKEILEGKSCGTIQTYDITVSNPLDMA